MGFGRNPHVAKAEAAEQKARGAKDAEAGKLAWRDAGRQWERAAERETDDKRRQQYAQRAEAARAEADSTGLAAGAAPAEAQAVKSKTPSLLN